jgi:hypothetical protein
MNSRLDQHPRRQSRLDAGIQQEAKKPGEARFFCWDNHEIALELFSFCS